MDDLLRLLASSAQPARLAGYDPVRQDIMEKTYAHDPAVGDPVITVGMDPYRVRQMTHPLEIASNMGTYYPDEDLVYLNPNLSPRDRSDTAKHEFRHRGAGILDSMQGIAPNEEFTLEEMVMILNDMRQGIGTDGFNLESMRYLLEDAAKEQDTTQIQALATADRGAASYNAQAREMLGGGAPYASPIKDILDYLTPSL